MSFQQIAPSRFSGQVTQQGSRGKGRPPLLEMDESLIEQIADLVRQGLFYVEAAAMCGISRSSIHRWMKQGVKDIDENKDTVFAYFCDAINRASAEAELERIGDINSAAKRNQPGSWQAAAWWLERRFPDRYGKQDRQQVELKGSLGLGVITANLDGKPEELTSGNSNQLAAIAAIIESRPDSDDSPE